MALKKVIAKNTRASANTYIGKEGELFFDPENPILRYSDGMTAGGLQISGGNGDTGNITFNGTTIGSPDLERITIQVTEDNAVNSRLIIDPDETLIKLEIIKRKTNEYYSSDWETANWVADSGIGKLVFELNDTFLYDKIKYQSEFDQSENREIKFYIDQGEGLIEFGPVDWQGYNYNQNTNTLTINLTSNEVPEGSVTVTRFDLIFDSISKISLDNDDMQSVEIDARGLPIDVKSTEDFNVNSNNINLYSTKSDDSHIRLYSGEYVRIRTNDHPDNSNQDYTWEFTLDGKINLPLGGFISEGEMDGFSTVEIIPAASDTSSPDQKLIIKGGFPEGDPEDYHLHLTTGDNIATTSIFLGPDEQHVKIDREGNVDIRSKPNRDINIIISPNNSEEQTIMWTFGSQSSIYFPDNSIQTTAWAGGRVRQVPISSKGDEDDKMGDLSFDSNFFYYCTADWTDGLNDIWKRVSWNSNDTWGS